MGRRSGEWGGEGGYQDAEFYWEWWWQWPCSGTGRGVNTLPLPLPLVVRLIVVKGLNSHSRFNLLSSVAGRTVALLEQCLAQLGDHVSVTVDAI